MRTSLKTLLALGILLTASAAITTTERATADTVKHPAAKETKAFALVPPNLFMFVPQSGNVRSPQRVEVMEGVLPHVAVLPGGVMIASSVLLPAWGGGGRARRWSGFRSARPPPRAPRPINSASRNRRPPAPFPGNRTATRSPFRFATP